MLSGAPEAVPGSVFTLLGLVPFVHHNSFLNTTMDLSSRVNKIELSFPH
jgi:hypothetical protein